VPEESECALKKKKKFNKKIYEEIKMNCRKLTRLRVTKIR